MKITSIAELKYANAAIGDYFFSEDTMRFWGSKVESDLLDNMCFVTSEDNFDRSKKLFSVRRADDNGRVDTVAFQKWDNLKDALDFAKKG